MSSGRLYRILCPLMLLAAVPSAVAQELRAVEIVPKRLSVDEGTFFTLRAYAHYDDGSKKLVTWTARWQVARDAAVQGGRWGFMGMLPGRAVVRAQYGGKTALATITVRPVRDQLRLMPAAAGPLRVGKSVQFYGLYRQPGKQARRVTAAGRWRSTDRKVLVHGPFGRFLAVGPGRADVILEFGGITVRRTLVVVDGARREPARPDVSKPYEPDPPRPVKPKVVKPKVVKPTVVKPTVMKPTVVKPKVVKPKVVKPTVVKPKVVKPKVVKPAREAGLKLSRERIRLRVGQTVTLHLLRQGLDVSREAYWSSSDPSVLERTGPGTFRARRPGIATIGATWGFEAVLGEVRVGK